MYNVLNQESGEQICECASLSCALDIAVAMRLVHNGSVQFAV